MGDLSNMFRIFHVIFFTNLRAAVTKVVKTNDVGKDTNYFRNCKIFPSVFGILD